LKGVIVIGIDPGIANTGFGVVRISGVRMVALDGGVIETDAEARVEQRLAKLHDSLGELVRWHEPTAMALEEVYFGKNVASALSVGEARGVALLAAAAEGLPCFGYTPQAVKKAVCGSGSADKGQIQRMVASLLGLPEPPAPDHAADAFAIAICHAGTVASRRAASHLGRARGATRPALATRHRLAG
jgi:crossover junction endodeoxyribonuclease RuvC